MLIAAPHGARVLVEERRQKNDRLAATPPDSTPDAPRGPKRGNFFGPGGPKKGYFFFGPARAKKGPFFLNLGILVRKLHKEMYIYF